MEGVSTLLRVRILNWAICRSAPGQGKHDKKNHLKHSWKHSLNDEDRQEHYSLSVLKLLNRPGNYKCSDGSMVAFQTMIFNIQ